MAYPILTDIFRAQVVMQGTSGLPEDQFVNNFYFRNDNAIDPTYSDLADAVEAVLNAFYNQQNGTATTTVAANLRGIASVTYKLYDLGQPAPRYPIVPPIDASWNAPSNGTSLPREVSLCLSFKGGPGPRQRGRIYVGPLTDGVVEGTAGGPRPTDAFELVLMESARNVLNTSEDVTWVVASPTGATTTVVTDGWVDDAFDTQRSRGLAASVKRRWDAAGVDV